MTTCCRTTQPFPSPRLDRRRLTGSRQTKRETSNEDTEFPIQVSSYAFRSRLPRISQVQAENIQRRKLPVNMSHLWSYGTPFLLKLLFSGNLPKPFYDEICRQTRPQKLGPMPGLEKAKPENYRPELWEPKDVYRIRELGRRVEEKIMDARLRQKNLSNFVWERKAEEHRKRTEVVLLRKAGFMEAGKKAYLEKIEKQSEKFKIRKGRTNPRADPKTSAPSPLNGVFKLTETKQPSSYGSS